MSAVGIMAENPSRRYSTSQLCQLIGVPRRSFYHFFETQEDLFIYCIHFLQEEFIRFDLSFPPNRTVQEYMEINFRFWHQQRSVIRVLMEYGHFYTLMHQISDNLARNGYSNFASYYEKDSLTYRLNTRLLILTVMTIYLEWMDEDFRTPVSALAQSAVSLMTKPLVKQT